MKVHRGNFLYALNWIRQRLFAYLESEMSKENIGDITPSYGEVLYMLQRKGTVNLSDITKMSHKDKSTITGVINQLEKNGYIIKKRDNQDRRFVYIEPTEKSKKVQPALRNISEKMNSRLFKGLSEEEKETLFKLVSKISENL
ncbi:MAG: MarR family transcriptional regulator [Dehalococcoidia bacterium]|nr:MarR family transcriptional regulator [Dehalococcoidia bacterium]MDD5494045.1 MarR family transcriptional regulator [Dehalococcoidia bacterium]